MFLKCVEQGPTPFRYSHLGSLVFLGGESASIDLTGVDTFLETLGAIYIYIYIYIYMRII